LGRAEGVIRRDQQIPREAARVGERVRALIMKVERNNRGPQIFLSRAHPEFMKKLFAQEVPEIYDGIIEIKAAARDPGSRAKIGVISRDSSIDPVGACVGMKGSRVQAVVQKLQGEKIDIIPWSEDTATFVVNALQPATVSRVVLDEDENRIEVVVPDDQLSLAIGRRGQNVRLASQLTESQIDIMTEDEASEKRQREFAERSKMFEEELDVDETLSQLLVAEGFAELEEVAYVELAELASIEGFDEELAEELQSRAVEALERKEEGFRNQRRELGVDDALAEIPHLTEEMLVVLGKAGIKTLDDLADLATDELIARKREAPRRRNPEAGPPLRRDKPRPEDKGGVLGEFGLSEEQGNEIIMAARAHWSEDEEAPAAGPVAEDAGDAEPLQWAARGCRHRGTARGGRRPRAPLRADRRPRRARRTAAPGGLARRRGAARWARPGPGTRGVDRRRQGGAGRGGRERQAQGGAGAGVQDRGPDDPGGPSRPRRT